MASNVKVSGGVSFCGLLAIAFIVLKLVGVVDWAWWVVLAPLWAPVALAVVMSSMAVVLKELERRVRG